MDAHTAAILEAHRARERHEARLQRVADIKAERARLLAELAEVDAELALAESLLKESTT